MSKRIWFWTILITGIAFRLYGITNPLLDNHAWRQVDTASMAANFLEYGFYPPFPQLNYDGPPPNFVELEFPLVPLITALLWSLFGQLDLIARGVVITFSAGTLLLIYLLGKEVYDRTGGLLAMAFFALNPLAVYYGRTVMPDSAMIFFMTASVYFLVRWSQSERFASLGLSAVSFSLAVLAKLPALMIGIPLLVLALQKYKGRILKEKAFRFFILVGFLPPLIYYYLAHLNAGTRFVSGIIQHQLGLETHDYSYLWKKLGRMVTGPLIVTALFAPFVRKARVGNLFFWAWAGVLFVYTITVGARIQLEYYLYPLVPLLCVLAGGTLGRFWGEAPGVVSGLLIFLICYNTTTEELRYYYRVEHQVLEQAKAVERHTNPGDLLILSDEPPMIFYYSHRKGWRLLPEKRNPEALEVLRAQGGRVFVVLPDSKLDPALKSYLDRHYTFFPIGNFYDLDGANS